MKSLEHRIPPPVVVLIIGILMGVTARYAPHVGLPRAVRVAAAAVIGVGGLLITALGAATFRRAQTTINPVDIEAASRLVVTGIFNYSRNPMYVGLTALLLGWAVYLATPWAALGPALFALFIRRFQILPEERVMRAKFGTAYDDYRQRVRRWL